jgi:hypothetical protein
MKSPAYESASTEENVVIYELRQQIEDMREEMRLRDEEMSMELERMRQLIVVLRNAQPEPQPNVRCREFRSSNKKKAMARNTRSNKRCFNCNELGHFSRDCVQPRKEDSEGSFITRSTELPKNLRNGISAPSKIAKTTQVTRVVSSIRSVAAMEVMSENNTQKPEWLPTSLPAETISAEQQADENIRKIFLAIRDEMPRPARDDVADRSSEERSLWRQWNRLDISNGCLVRRFKEFGGRRKFIQWIVPASRREDLIAMVHGNEDGGLEHKSHRCTKRAIQSQAFWPGWKTDVRRVVQQCPLCCQRGMVESPDITSSMVNVEASGGGASTIPDADSEGNVFEADSERYQENQVQLSPYTDTSWSTGIRPDYTTDMARLNQSKCNTAEVALRPLSCL